VTSAALGGTGAAIIAALGAGLAMVAANGGGETAGAGGDEGRGGGVISADGGGGAADDAAGGRDAGAGGAVGCAERGGTVSVAVLPECASTGFAGGAGDGDGGRTRVGSATGSGVIFRVASSAIVASDCGGGSGITTRISTAPSCSLSWSRRARGPVNRCPFTIVPFELPRSSTTSSAPRRRSTA